MILSLKSALLSWIRRHWPEIVAVVVVVAVVAVVLCLEIIPTSTTGLKDDEHFRNLILMLAAAGALPFAVWRSRSGQRQADATQEQADAVAEQVRGATLARLNDQFTAAATMMGHDSTSVRRLGIQSLQQLALDHPGDYYVRALRALCDYAREPFTGDSDLDEVLGPHGRLRSDVQGAVQMIGQAWSNVEARQRGLVKEPNYVPNLIGANLTKGRFWSLNLERAHLEQAICVDAVFGNVNLRGVNLDGTNLTRTDFTGGRIDDRESGSPVSGLTQRTLDRACVEEGKSPMLDGVLDLETGKQLEWRGEPCPDSA